MKCLTASLLVLTAILFTACVNEPNRPQSNERTLGQWHNHAVQAMWTKSGTIDERLLQACREIAPDIDSQEMLRILHGINDKTSTMVLPPDAQAVIDDLTAASKSLEFCDYKGLDELYAGIAARHTTALVPEILELHKASFDLWSANPDKRPLSVGSLGVIADTGFGILVTLYLGPIAGGLVGAAASVWYMEAMEECRSHCVYPPYLGPNQPCCP